MKKKSIPAYLLVVFTMILLFLCYSCDFLKNNENNSFNESEGPKKPTLSEDESLVVEQEDQQIQINKEDDFEQTNKKNKKVVTIETKEKLYEHLTRNTFVIGKSGYIRFEPNIMFLQGFGYDDFTGGIKCTGGCSLSGTFKVTSASSVMLYNMMNIAIDGVNEVKEGLYTVDQNGNIKNSSTTIYLD